MRAAAVVEGEIAADPGAGFLDAGMSEHDKRHELVREYRARR